MDSQVPNSLAPSAPVQALNPEAMPSAAAPETSEAPASGVPAYKMLQTATKQAIDVPHDDVYTAVKSGQYLPSKTDSFVIKDSNGEGRVVEGEYLKQALDEGFRLESSQEMHERTLQEQYGGASGMAQAFGAGVARGGTVGLSDLAAAGSPDAQAHLSNLEEANPVSSALGNVAGFVGGSLLGSTEESAVARGAGLLVKGTESLGAKAGQLVERALIKDATKAGVSAKIATSIASKMAQEAVVGGVIGAGNYISEAALGKADVNAENLAASIGMGAIIGGSIGGVFGVVGAAAPLAVKGAKMIAEPFVNQVEHSLNDTVAAARIFGLTPTQLWQLEERNPGIVKGMKDYLKDDLQLSYTDTAESILHKNKTLQGIAGKEIGEALDTMDKAFEFRKDLMPTKQSVWSAVREKITKDYADWLAEEVAPGTSKVSNVVKDFLDDVKKLSNSEGSFGAKDLQKLKRMQDELINFEKTPGKMSILEEMAHTTRNTLKEQIDAAATRLHDAGTEDLAQKIREANRKYAAASTFGDFLEKRALKAADKTLSLMGVIRDVGLDVSRKMAVLGKIESATQATSRLIDKTVKNFVAPVSEVAKKLPLKHLVPVSIIDSEFAKKYEDGKYKKPKTVSEAFVNLNDNFARYTNNPEAFTSRINRTTSSIYNQAPQTSAALDTVAVAGATFLASKIPKRASAPGMLDMFNKPRPPSSYDLAKFERYLTAVEHPNRIFEDMQAGRLNHESVEAMQAVYPNLYSQLQQKVMEQVGQNPQMPYNRKIQLGTLLNVATDESLLPENVLALQSLIHKPEDPQSGNESAVKPTQAGAKAIASSERMATDTQAETELDG